MHQKYDILFRNAYNIPQVKIPPGTWQNEIFPGHSGKYAYRHSCSSFWIWLTLLQISNTKHVSYTSLAIHSRLDEKYMDDFIHFHTIQDDYKVQATFQSLNKSHGQGIMTPYPVSQYLPTGACLIECHWWPVWPSHSHLTACNRFSNFI